MTTASAPQGAATVLYLYDLNDRLLMEADAAGTPLVTYVWRDDIPVSLIVNGSPETVLYLETDHLNTPRAARNQQKAVVWRWESDAFGATLANEDPGNTGTKTTINLRFPGQYFDRESGLHYNHHRYYDPKIGRYMSSDPIGLAGGLNTYQYADLKPISNIDPFGLTPGTVAGAAIGTAIAPGPGTALGALIGTGVQALVGGAAMAAILSTSGDSPSDRDIWWPEKTPGRWSCKARADCNDNIPGNCPDNPSRRFAFGGGSANDLGTARNVAKANATSNLQCQPKHVSCKCTGPKGEQYSGGC